MPFSDLPLLGYLSKESEDERGRGEDGSAFHLQQLWMAVLFTQSAGVVTGLGDLGTFKCRE